MDARPEKTVIEYSHLKVVIDYKREELTLTAKSGSETAIPFAAIPELLAALTVMGRQVPNALQGSYHKTR